MRLTYINAQQGEYTMKKIKDIFYDMNDFLVALIIIAVAALVITTNINSILNYPSSIAAEIQVPEEKTPTNYAENPPITEPGSDDASDQGTTTSAGIADQNTTGGGVSGSSGTNGGTSGSTGANVGGSGAGGSEKPAEYSVYINPGSTEDKIADILVGVGLFNSRQEFNSAVAAAGAAGKLRAGNFIIPSDSTPAEVISILTH